eukprot:c44313_g1_i1 orf=1-798(-)
MFAKRPRVVIIGAGMAGIAAANKLQQVSCAGSPCFDLTLLEASQRIGGRICTAQFGGDQLEIGATWIHGIEGSPIYEIAQKIGAVKGETPWERQDGFPEKPTMIAEGGLNVDPALIEPTVDLYKKLMSEVRDIAASRGNECQETIENQAKRRETESVGAFLRDRLNSFMFQEANVSEIERLILTSKRNGCVPIGDQAKQFSWTDASDWNSRSLKDAVFSMHESMERIASAVNSLFDLDLESEKEYLEYPGEHISIGKGYVSVLHEL